MLLEGTLPIMHLHPTCNAFPLFHSETRQVPQTWPRHSPSSENESPSLTTPVLAPVIMGDNEVLSIILPKKGQTYFPKR